jgi:integrase
VISFFPTAREGLRTIFCGGARTSQNEQDLQSGRILNYIAGRKTGATRHHESGVSVRKIQSWLGHESLDVTLAYLGVEDAADEYSQEQVNNGALAEFV